MRIFRSDATLMVEELDAFLAGAYVEMCEARQERVPVWAWMNLLAHGTAEELQAAVHRDQRADRWRQARAYVAGELLERLDAAEMDLADFQREVLVPLELEIASCRAAEQWRSGPMFAGLLGTLPSARHR